MISETASIDERVAAKLSFLWTRSDFWSFTSYIAWHSRPVNYWKGPQFFYKRPTP